jgi:hypothetical protein
VVKSVLKKSIFSSRVKAAKVSFRRSGSAIWLAMPLHYAKRRDVGLEFFFRNEASESLTLVIFGLSGANYV